MGIVSVPPNQSRANHLPNPSPNNYPQQVGVDVAAHVQAFLSKADLGVRMTGADGLVLDAVRGSVG